LSGRLATHYGWNSVEVYWVDPSAGKFKLLSQHPTSPDKESLEHDLFTGLLERAYQTGQDISVEDVSSDPAWQGVRKKLRPSTVSALCLPIRVDGQIKALLNVEDTLRCAFSRDEQLTLRNLLDEVGNLLGAAQTQSLIVQTFLSTPSAVFVTDSAGTIVRINPAAAALLGYPERELVNTKVHVYFANIEDPLALLKPGSPETETALKTKAGRTVPVLAGAHELAGFGAWVISAKER
jgi:PAS domain S-box-containing protein